jgi:shikimate dehydrogenase
MNKLIKKEIFALIGDPVSHSVSSCMHNAAFSKLGLKAEYVTFRVKPKDLKKAIDGIRALGIKGLNVTIPHKEKCLKFLDRIESEAQKIGAVNTILNRNGKLIGFNTDGDGFVDSLKNEAGVNPKGKNVFIAGAGGAARAVGFTLAKNEASIIVLIDIKNDKAGNLRNSLRKHYPNCDIKAIAHKDKKEVKEAIAASDIFVNATGLGLKPSDPLVINPYFLHRGLLVCDLIYNPRMPNLLKAAKKRKIKTLNGEGMLFYQGIRAFKIWTGTPAPEDTMRKALSAFLKSKPR